VPMIGCDCRVCRSSDPKDRRLRPSILIEIDAPDNLAAAGAEGSGEPRQSSFGDQRERTRDARSRTQEQGNRGAGVDAHTSAVARAVRTILVDTSTDLRAQALTHDVRRVDAILFTHSHADHVLGLDEVRRYNAMQRQVIPCFADTPTIADLRQTFGYIFNPATPAGGGIPQLELHRILGAFMLGGVEILPVPILHGKRPILGFRVGTFAYLTDCSAIPETSWPLLSGVRTVIIDALRDRPHPTHFSVAEALEAVARIAPERAYFTHIAHDLPHAETCARLPAGVELAYDGLVLSVF
jgi:phosphoribosyl 1,2-cyclic phosphate phosphodiesterase